MNFDHAKVRRFVERDCKMQYDFAGAKLADEMASRAGLTQAQFDEAVKLHAVRVQYLFTPQSYGWKERFALAAMFLGLASPPWK